MKKTFLVLGLLSTSLFARPDWNMYSYGDYNKSSSPDIIETIQLIREALKTKYDCKIIDKSDEITVLACFADDDVITFCSITEEEINCWGE